MPWLYLKGISTGDMHEALNDVKISFSLLRRFKMNATALDQLETRYGTTFAVALRRLLLEDSTTTVEAWHVDEAKEHFSRILDLVCDGKCQLVRRRSEDPVIVMSIAQLAHFVEVATPKRSFADLIAYDHTLPAGNPLTLDEAASGIDRIKI